MPDLNDAPDLDATVPVAGPTPSAGSTPRLTVNLPLPEDLAKLLPEGTYTVQSFLGQGGMGAVYRGTQVRLQRQVAIKIMCRDQGRDHGFEERFRREALALAQLNHPNIVNVIDYGEAGPDYLYIVMEFVDGTDLVGVIRSGQMTQETALKLLPQICDALQFAHDNGIVHRDIKPANILLTRDGRIKMADFGLAKRFDVNSTFQTQAGAGMGTPDYAAPEQFDPNGNVDHRADIYALGVMIYQMVTGQLPRGAWKPPSEKADVDAHWDKIVSHALQTDPSDRYASVSDIKTDISSISLPVSGQGGVPGSAVSRKSGFSGKLGGSTTALTQAGGRRVTTVQASAPPRSKKPLVFGLAGVLVLSAAAGFLIWKKDRPVVEEPTVPFASRTWTPPAPTVSAGTEWTNLIPHIKPERDVIRGGWTVDEKGLTAQRAEWAICSIPVQDPGTDYDLRYKVTRGEGSHLAMFFAFRKGSTGGYVPIDYIYDKAPEFADGQRWATIEDLTHLEMRDAATPKAKRKEWLPRGKACIVLLQVREKEVIVSVNDEEAFRWPAEWSKLQQRGGAGGSMFLDVSGGPIFGVGIFNCEAVFHSIEMRRIGEPKTPTSAATPATATKDVPFENTLGMKFVPVPITGGPTDGKRVLFSMWETRMQDYEAFVKETKREWEKPQFKREPSHPAVMVSWEDATAFCVWLTDRERTAGKLAANERYRLPTDHEWSCAVGIGDHEDASKTPQEKSRKITDVFPWGGTWPPPAGTGNYAGEELQAALAAGRYVHIKSVLAGYHDSHELIAPVGSFPASNLGLHDLSGNVWEWCVDWLDASQKACVLRGGSWDNSEAIHLLSSDRIGTAPDKRSHGSNGFRCVVTASAPTGHGWSKLPTEEDKKLAFINTLGMKFVPVPITGGPTDGKRVLFSVWETRVQDYEAFVKETKRVWPKPGFVQEPVHPAVMVSIEEARLFCSWLTERERRAGKLGPHETYRLPTDHEWSCAVGIGDKESATMTPREKNNKLSDLFPWGSTWPPPANSGNFWSEELRPLLTTKTFLLVRSELSGYLDGHATTAPVGSYMANALGLHDLGGNVWEWCADWMDGEQKEWVLRGASWAYNGRGVMLLSGRTPGTPGAFADSHGFRCVLVSNEGN